MLRTTLDLISICPGAGVVIGVTQFASNSFGCVEDVTKIISASWKGRTEDANIKAVAHQKLDEAKSSLALRVTQLFIAVIKVWIPILGGVIAYFWDNSITNNYMKTARDAQDPAIAITNYKMAIQMGSVKAMNDLAEVYKKPIPGLNLEERNAELIYWKTEAANHGMEEAIDDLAYIYREGSFDQPQNYVKSLDLVNQLLKLDEDHSRALYLRYDIYNNQYGMVCESEAKREEFKQKAMEDLKRSSELGFPQARHDLGWHYLKGEGMQKDAVKGFECMKYASEHGFTEANIWLGYCYETATGTQQDYVKAFAAYSKEPQTLDAKLRAREIFDKLPQPLPPPQDRVAV